MIVTNLEIVKSWIVGGTFVRSADESYITARWCIQTGQNSDFAWLAVHAFEKYMKAVLLMNGKTSKGHGHDIGKIYEAIKLLCNGLLPNSLQKESTTPETYLNSLYSIGHPDARYGLFDSNVRLDDLNNLDRMVYIIRRLICPLDQKIDEVGNMPSDSIPTYRDWLGANANDCLSIGGLLGKVIKDKTSPLRVPALNCNLAFSPADFGHDHDWENSAWRKSPISQHILDLLNSSSDVTTVEEAIELANWVISNIQMTEPPRKVINEAISAANARMLL